MGVEGHLDELAGSTKEAIAAFPRPAIRFVEGELQAIATRVFGRTGAGPFLALAGVKEQLQEEANRKIEEFATMYIDWWERHSVTVRERASHLHAAIADAAVAGFEQANAST